MNMGASCRPIPWRLGILSMKPHFAIRLTELLGRHKVSNANLEVVSEAAKMRDAPDIIDKFLPTRTIHFDPECIMSGEDFETVVGHFADATGGAWDLSELEGKMDWRAERGAVDFEVAGVAYHWEFEQIADYVSSELLKHIELFARTHLPGDFVEVPSPDQCYCAVYLERPAAQELRPLFEEYKDAFSH